MLKTTPKVIDLIKKCSSGLSLDAGCGSGEYLNFFKNSVVALDITLSLLKEAKSSSSIQEHFFVLGDIRSLPFRNRVFGYVLCKSALEHIHEKDCIAAISELKRVTGGTLQIDVPNNSLVLELLRKILYGRWRFDKGQRTRFVSNSPLHHHSVWTVRRLRALGFKVRGCIGWVAMTKHKLGSLHKVLDLFLWNLPCLAGTIIGIEYFLKGQQHARN